MAPEELDLSAIVAAYERELRGFAPCHPAMMMVALPLDAHSRGVLSSRAMAWACEERLDFMAVTALLRTIADFRERHPAALATSSSVTASLEPNHAALADPATPPNPQFLAPNH